MVLLLKGLTKKASVNTTHPPGEEEAFCDEEGGARVNAMEEGCGTSKGHASFNKDGVAHTCPVPWKVIPEILHIASEKNTGAE